MAVIPNDDWAPQDGFGLKNLTLDDLRLLTRANITQMGTMAKQIATTRPFKGDGPEVAAFTRLQLAIREMEAVLAGDTATAALMRSQIKESINRQD